ncbi:MAG: hypothetical protein NC924_05355 [Candidatus Omnitrophica bacterium]|nr:hypothetical protein [Candidatus Omnitrophota bacterium]
MQITQLSDKNYRIQYDPPDTDEYAFTYEQVITVSVSVQDEHGNLLDTSYSFTTARYIMGPNIRVNQNTAGEQTASDITMDNNGKNIYIVWQDGYDIWFSSSADRGKTFGSEIKLSNGIAGTNECPSIAVDNPGNIFIAWQNRNSADQYNLYFARRSKNRTTFEIGIIPVDTHLGNSDQKYPRLCAFHNNDLVLCWANEQNHAIYLATSGNGGESFWQLLAADLIRVDDTTAVVPRWPSVQVDASGHTKVLCWSAEKSGVRNIYFNKINRTNQRAFAADVQVNDVDAAATADRPVIACRPSVNNSGHKANIGIIWEREKDNKWDILLDLSGNGTTWGTDRVIAADSSAADRRDPRLAMANNGNLFCAWAERPTDTSTQHYDIYAAYSLDNGASFAAPVHIDDDGADAEQRAPALALNAGGSQFCLAWTDYRDGTADIFFNRNSLYDAENTCFQLITPDADAEIKKDGFCVALPAGCLPAPVCISITPLDCLPEFASPQHLVRNFIDFGPGGTTFEKPVTITLPYSQTELDAAGITDPLTLCVYYFNLKTLAWEQIAGSSVDRMQQTVSAAVNHFSIYALASAEPTPPPAAAESDSGSSSRCFIASAVYGSAAAPEVIVLRSFRDKYLMRPLWGRIAVGCYYRGSPGIADYLRDHPKAQKTARQLLDPVVDCLR